MVGYLLSTCEDQIERMELTRRLKVLEVDTKVEEVAGSQSVELQCLQHQMSPVVDHSHLNTADCVARDDRVYPSVLNVCRLCDKLDRYRFF